MDSQNGTDTPEPQLIQAESSPKTANNLSIIVALIALAGGAGWWTMSQNTSAAHFDNISTSTLAKLSDDFSRAHGSFLPVDLSRERRDENFLALLPMSKTEAIRLMELVDRGERSLGWLMLWDNLDEDGDVASVTAAGFTQSVALRHAPTRILVPYIPGQPVLITGEHDGRGGGVTVAVELSTGPLPLPPLAVGQTVALPIQ